ncbi:MAG: transcription activator, effector binding protein [Firmicutes bacterium]|nr:transcription activator, effector binding protein [Bacillota bacterium]
MFEISLQEKKAQPVIFIRTKTQIDMLPKLLEETSVKIKRYLKEAGVMGTDVLYTRYHDGQQIGNDLDVEIGMPISQEVQGIGELRGSVIPAGKYVVATYTGDPDELEKTYDGILKWIDEADLKPSGAYFEYYYGEEENVPEEFKAKIVVPV